jgi:putative ATP-dependent endonuclease of OLD family
MAETVLVPEGAIDFEWLMLLARAVELQADADTEGSIFSTSVGVVPTSDAAVIETSKRLAMAHDRIVPVVDGDAAGKQYVTGLVAAGAIRILRWTDDWTIEDAVGWVLEPGENDVIASIATEISPAPATLAELVTRLKNDRKDDPTHLKGDRIAYEAIARAIADTEICRGRAAELLDAIAIAGQGGNTVRFTAPDVGQPVFVFQP